MRQWDLLVVGGGTAGLVAARTAAGFGARVLLVERGRTGGDCLWTGCVPSKSLLAAAHAAADARGASRLGVDSDVSVDFARVRAHVAAAIERILPDDSPESLRAAGVQVRTGTMTFTGPRSAMVDGVAVRFRRAIVATGSRPLVPHIAGLDDPLTTDSVWELETLPARLLVLGGGSVGCELGQAFARLGSAVTIVEQAPQLLPDLDDGTADRLAAALHADGVDVRTATTVRSVRGDTAALDDGTTVGFDRVLVATGRTPRTDLGLDAAGVELDDHGFVRTDGRLRTSNPDVWAAGDVTGRALFTHVAGVDGSTAATNAVLGLRRRVDAVVPRVTYTSPEIASVGTAPASGARVRTIEHAEVDRAVTGGRTEGVTRLVLDRRGRVIGGLVVGPRAGEAIAEITLAVRHGLRARDLAATTHAYPGWTDGTWNAAIADVRAQLAAPVAATAIRTLRLVRRASAGVARRPRR